MIQLHNSLSFQIVLDFLPIQNKVKTLQLSTKLKEKIEKHRWITYDDFSSFLNERSYLLKVKSQMLIIQTHEIEDLEQRMLTIEKDAVRDYYYNTRLEKCRDCGFECPLQYLVRSKKGIIRCGKCYQIARQMFHINRTFLF